MTSKRIITWASFIVIIGLIIWGLIAAQMKSNREQNLVVLPGTVVATDHVTVSTSTPVTIVEYGDFQCPACAQFFPIVEKILTEVGSSTVRLVFRHFPLQQHQNALPSAYASEAASMQGKFWEMYRILYDRQEEWQGLTDPKAVFSGYAKELGLDTIKFESDMELPEIAETVLNDYKGGVAAGIQGTPTFFVNGKQIANPQSYDEFKTLIQKAASEGTAS